MDFSKPALTHAEQIELLASRGLIIEDKERACHYLSHINYYRLTGYWLSFQSDRKAHQFKAQTHFEDVLNLYIFDRELRLLLLDAIERIEVSLRAQWGYSMAHRHGAHCYLDPQFAANSELHSKHLRKLLSELSRSDEVFIEHYSRTYKQPPTPPIWAVSEIMSLGMLSRWITHMLPSDRAVVAHVYGMDQSVLKGFVRHLTYLRNLCAHHGRLWNRRFTITMPLPRTKPSALISSFNPSSRRQLYNSLVMIAGLLEVVSPSSLWKQRLCQLLSEHNIDTQAMGFPSDWSQRSVWTNKEQIK